MEQEERKEPITDIYHPDYDPDDDPEVQDNIWEFFDSIRDRLMPYQRYIMIVGFIILVMLVVFLGYARGALDVCNDLGGRLEVGWKILCHPGQYIPIQNTDRVGMPFMVPDLIKNGS